ncbi:YidB family protein [Bdellovibrio sp. HCB337]|uniref:YidB family protein n=1 Tax=Bdellovibrio sp. HCB337 TaxID=3394358 RepID=UPI0039A713C0
MSMMDSIQEKAAGILGSSNTQVTQAISKIIDASGGMDGLVKKFQDKGLGDVVQSWISSAPNKSVTSDQIMNVLGPDLVQRVASKVGMTPESLSQQVATYLPLLVDKLTPNGMIPHEGWWARSLDKAKEFFGMKH